MADDFISDRRIYLTAPESDPEAEAVEEGDERARVLLVGEGGTVPADVAARFQLKAQAPAEDKAEAPAEDKAEEPAEAPADAPEAKAKK